MGFFSKISKGVTDFISDPTGAKAAARAQVGALREAGRFEEARRLEELEFAEKIFGETARFREAGAELLGQFRGQAPGTSQFFQRGLETGTTALAQRAAEFGLLDSTAFGQGAAELGAGLLTQEEALRQQALATAAGLGTTGIGQTQQARFGALGLAGRQAQTIADIGAVQAGAAGAGRRFFTGLALTAGGAAIGAQFGAPALGGFAGANLAGSLTGAQAGQTLRRP
jgi:hypothetical protein